MTTSNNTVKKQIVIEWTIRIASFIMSIAIMVSSFFLTEAWGKISNIEREMNQLKLESTIYANSQFTFKQWVDAKTILDGERNAMDRRLIRIEETYPTINNAVLEIKQSIKQLEQEKNE